MASPNFLVESGCAPAEAFLPLGTEVWGGGKGQLLLGTLQPCCICTDPQGPSKPADLTPPPHRLVKWGGDDTRPRRGTNLRSTCPGPGGAPGKCAPQPLLPW